MCLSSNILPAFEQLNLYEELMAFAKRGREGRFYLDQLKVIAPVLVYQLTRYDRILFVRPELYYMLYNKVLPKKMHMPKKVLSFRQNHEGATHRFSDNTTIQGYILVGADGAHSAIRSHLYKTLNKQGLIPRSDTEAMSVGYISLVETTDALDLIKYSCVLQEKCDTVFIIGDGNTPNTMLGSIRHFKTTYGTLGDLFDATQINRVSKVAFADKLFETWNYDRVVLIGDAAAKYGCKCSERDTRRSTSCQPYVDISVTNFENVQAAMNGYKNERFDAVKE
ncbi:hypothetical protein BGZ47_003209 [Haplosporangium gracile]|nr:hypothetical protein BGZ47_003209 [Haplosporangium gracile]